MVGGEARRWWPRSACGAPTRVAWVPLALQPLRGQTHATTLPPLWLRRGTSGRGLGRIHDRPRPVCYLARPPVAHCCTVPAGRRDRRHGPAARAAPLRRPGAASGGREPCRRGRHDRHRRRGSEHGRPHAADGVHRARGEPRALPAPALRQRGRLRAGRAGRGRAEPPGGAGGPALAHASRTGRGGPPAAGRADLRLGRQRHLHPPGRRAVLRPRRDRDDPRALPRLGPRGRRPRLRAARRDVRQRHLRRARTSPRGGCGRSR